MPSDRGSRWGMGLIVAGGLVFGLAAGALIFFSAPAAVAAPTPLAAPTAANLPAQLVAAPPPATGALAADFSLADLSGHTVKLSDFKGDVVLVNFWATWCGPCQVEMPTLEKYYQSLKDQGLVILAVEQGDPLPDVQAFVNDHGLTFPVVWDEKAAAADLYHVSALPTSFIVDREGKLLQQRMGMFSDASLEDFLAVAGLKKS